MSWASSGLVVGLVYLVHLVFLVGLELEAAGHILFDVEGVLRVGVGEVFVVGMLRYVVLVAQERAQAADLEDTLAAVEGGDLVLGHQLFAIMSSDEFKKQKKGQSAQGRLTFGRQGIATSPYRLFTLYLHSDHNLNNRYRLANSRIFHNSSDNAAHTDFLSEYPSQNHLSASI